MTAIPKSENFEDETAPAICESCGASFGCGAKIGECWCFKVEIKAKFLANLREQFENCLCEKCLTEASSERAVSQKNAAAETN